MNKEERLATIEKLLDKYETDFETMVEELLAGHQKTCKVAEESLNECRALHILGLIPVLEAATKYSRHDVYRKTIKKAFEK